MISNSYSYLPSASLGTSGQQHGNLGTIGNQAASPLAALTHDTVQFGSRKSDDEKKAQTAGFKIAKGETPTRAEQKGLERAAESGRPIIKAVAKHALTQQNKDGTRPS